MTRVLVIGYGNPGRLDDGLGPALAQALQEASLPGVSVDCDYQLTVDDAAEAARHEVVIFADAAVQGREPFFFKKLQPVSCLSYSSHEIAPENVLALAEELFNSSPAGYVLGIRGYEFNEFGETLSAKAGHNLAQALQFMFSVLKKNNFPEMILE